PGRPRIRSRLTLIRTSACERGRFAASEAALPDDAGQRAHDVGLAGALRKRETVGVRRCELDHPAHLALHTSDREPASDGCNDDAASTHRFRRVDDDQVSVAHAVLPKALTVRPERADAAPRPARTIG